MRICLIVTIPFFAALAGCVSEGSQMVADAGANTASALGTTERVYVRADGKRLSTNPALQQQLDLDRTICRGEAQKFGLVAKDEIETQKKNIGISLLNAGIREAKVNEVMKGCMAQRGYLYMTVAEAEARADTLAANGSKKKRKRVAG